MPSIKDLQDKRAVIWNQMNELRNKEGDFKPEDRTAWDTAEADLDGVSKDIERLERAAELDKIQTKPIAELTNGRVEQTPAEASEAEKYERAFTTYLKRGAEGLSHEQRLLMAQYEARDQATGGPANAGSQTAGGYTVPPGFLVRMTEVLKAYGGLIKYAEILNTSTGNPLQFPTNDDTANVGHILGENVAETNLADFAFGTKTLGAYMYTSGLVKVSYQLLQDSAFDLNSWLPNRLGIRLGRALATSLVTGNGTSAPEGLMTNMATGVTGAVGTTTSFGATTAAAYSNLIDLQHSIDPAYRPGSVWGTSDAGLKVLRKLVDANGRPLWEPYVAGSLSAPVGSDGSQTANELGGGSGGTILNHAVIIDQGIAAPAANAKSLFFGNVREALIVRQVAGADTLRLAERYADQLQVGFFGFARFDSKSNAAGAVRAYANSAT